MERIARILRLLGEYDEARKKYQKVLHKGGWRVTGPQVGVLRIVAQRQGISISELAANMSIHITTAEGYAKRLARLGYVRLERDPVDRRRQLVYLTELGAKILAEVPLGFKSLLVHNLKKAGIQEQETLLKGLEIMIKYLKEEN